MHIDIELKGELTRGMTVCDYRHLRGVEPGIDLHREPQMDFRGEKPNAEGALELDFPGFMELLYRTLENYNQGGTQTTCHCGADGVRPEEYN